MGTDLRNLRQCRLCLHYSEHLLPIFGEVGREKNISQKLQTHLHLEIVEDKTIPQHVCLKCLDTLEAFEKFYIDVAHNQSLLLENSTATVGILVQDDEHMKIEGCDADEEEVLIEEGEFLMLDRTTRNEAGPGPETFRQPLNPPSYDEAQQNKRVQTEEVMGPTVPVTAFTSGKERVADDHCYIQKPAEELGKSTDEAETDDNDATMAFEGEEGGIIVKVSNEKFQYPKMIRDGSMRLRGEALKQCMGRFYGLACEMCKENSATIDELFEHYRTQHGVDGFVTCCRRKIEKHSLMAMHMARHLEPEAFECPHCKKMMTTPRILKIHIKNHLPEEQRPLKCELCPRRFSYVSGLLMHASSHQAANECSKAYHICDKCGRVYRTRNRLLDHIGLSHAEDGNDHCARCELCGKKFNSKSNLKYHMTTHEPNEHQVQCENCGKWLKNKICLRKHMVQHSQVRLRCSKCDYTAINPQSMQSHLRVQHSDEKPYVCQICGKGFKLKCNLRNHLPQHTGERNFKCEFCSRQFVASSNYYSHRKRMHFEEVQLKRRKQELEDSAIRKKLQKANRAK